MPNDNYTYNKEQLAVDIAEKIEKLAYEGFLSFPSDDSQANEVLYMIRRDIQNVLEDFIIIDGNIVE